MHFIKTQNSTMKTFFFLAIALAAVSSQAQNVRIVNGAEYEASKSDGVFDDVLDLDNNSFYVRRLSTAGSGFTHVIQKVDRKLGDVNYTMEYKYDESSRDLVDETEIQTSLVKDKFFVFTRKFNIKESIVYLLFRKFDAATGAEIGTQQGALNIECSKQIAPKVKFYVEFSADKSKMLIGSNTSSDMVVYDTKTVAKLGTLTLNLKETGSYSDFTVDNSGNLLYLSREKDNLALIKLELNNKNPFIYQLSDKIKGFKNSHIEITKTNIIVCGLTSNMEVFYINFDPQSAKVVSNTLTPLNPKVKEQLDYGFDGRFGADGKYYAFEKLVFGKESVYLVESHSFSTVIYGNGKPVTYANQNEILVTKFSANGEYQWMKLIPKQNYSQTAGFNMICKNDELYLFYLQHPKDDVAQNVDQYDHNKTGLTTGLGGCAFVCAKIDSKGSITRKMLFANKGWCYKPISKNIVDEGEKSLTIKMIKGKKERYDKLFVE